MNKEINWSDLPFGYYKTDYRFIANYSDGCWDEGVLSKDDTIVLNESAAVLQYAQTVFEGLKAYRTFDDRIVVFRADENAKRMELSAKGLEMPVFPKERFLQAVKDTVKANIDFVPPYGSNASLYLRPYMFGLTPVLGVKPASDYQFRIIASPVGSYFKGGIKPLNLKVSDYDRAAPRGTGHIKAGLNYAMSMHPYALAHKEGFDENVYLDSATRTKIEETGGANIIFVDKNGELVIPSSSSILPSITRKSIIYVAENMLGIKVNEREVYFDEIGDFKECGLCGTAAVISPVGSITKEGTVIKYTQEIGKVCGKLLDSLRGIQKGLIEAPEGWLMEIK